MRLLIADDEDYTREGLIESIPWSDYGIKEIRQARDGEEALSISLAFKPDIVLTDIKMPKLNGIEFAEAFIQKCPDSKLLFISGYLEIEYLKSAIKLSVVEYIEKPINITTVEHAVKKAIKSINEKKKQMASNTEKKELQTQKLANMLRSKSKDKEDVYRICEEIEYAIESNYIAVVVEKKEREISEDHTIKKISDFWKQNNYRVISTDIEDGRYLTILELKEIEEKKIYKLCEKLLESEEKFCLGAGFCVNNIMKVSESYECALFNLNRCFYTSDQRIFTQDDTKSIAKAIDSRLYTEFNVLMNHTPQKLVGWMEQLFQKLCKTECYKKKHLQNLFFTFTKVILQDKKILITKLKDIYSEDDIEIFIMNTKSIVQLKAFMMDLAEKHQAELVCDFKYSKLVRDIITYIDQHYIQTDLSIEDIAQHIHFSAVHLSVLFKHETGITIKQYIGDYRLKISKKMLANKHYKITEVARLCGYSNANYFAKVFKAATNQSPVEYRKRSQIIYK